MTDDDVIPIPIAIGRGIPHFAHECY